MLQLLCFTFTISLMACYCCSCCCTSTMMHRRFLCTGCSCKTQKDPRVRANRRFYWVVFSWEWVAFVELRSNGASYLAGVSEVYLKLADIWPRFWPDKLRDFVMRLFLAETSITKI